MGFDDAQTLTKALTVPAAKDSNKTEEHPAATKPRGATTSSGLQAFRSAVELIERDVGGLRDGALDRSFAPPRVVIEGIGSSIQVSLKTAVASLTANPASPEETLPLAERLATSLALLSAIARQHQLPMAETHLETVFELEDDIRVGFTGLGRANRADGYYDANLQPAADRTTPTAAGIQDALTNDSSQGSEPATRDQLVAKIVGFVAKYQAALRAGVKLATEQIKEPNQPKQPKLLETLIEAAASVLIAQAMSALNLVFRSALAAAAKSANAEEHLGKQLTDMLIDGFNDSGKENTVSLIRPSSPPAEPDEDTGLSAKSGFLVTVDKRTEGAIAKAQTKFDAQQFTLKRTPVDILKSVSDALGVELAERVERTYGDLIIHQWVNYMKDAFGEGVDVRDADKKPSGQSKLDALEPPGLLKIGVRVDEGDRFELATASLPGVGDAVLAHIRAEKKRNTLGSLPLYRRVEAFTPGESVWLDGFNLDPKGKLTAELPRVTKQARAMWAKFVNHSTGDEVSDGEVYAGMQVLQAWLNTIPTDKIEGAE